MSKPERLTRQEAVAERYFTSVKQAANLASQRKGPPFFKPNRGRVLYLRTDLEAWVLSSRVRTGTELSISKP